MSKGNLKMGIQKARLHQKVKNFHRSIPARAKFLLTLLSTINNFRIIK
jgi:hypothetical protein